MSAGILQRKYRKNMEKQLTTSQSCGLHLDLMSDSAGKREWFQDFAEAHNHTVDACRCGLAYTYVRDDSEPPRMLRCRCGGAVTIHGSRVLAVGRLFDWNRASMT